MRGQDVQQAARFRYLSPEERVPTDHPLRPIRAMVDEALVKVSPRFAGLYSPIGRPSIPLECQLRTLLLQALYSVRSERLLKEQFDYNLLYRWVVGLKVDDPVWDVTVFTKNRDQLLEGDAAHAFFAQGLAQAREGKLLSDEPDRSLDRPVSNARTALRRRPRTIRGAPRWTIGAKSSTIPPTAPPLFPIRGCAANPTGRQPSFASSATFCWKTGTGWQWGRIDPGHRNRRARGGTEDGAAYWRQPAHHVWRRQTLTIPADHVDVLRSLNATLHMAQTDTNRKSAINGRTTGKPGYAVSQRMRIEEIFGWLKTVAGLRKTRHRGLNREGWMFTFSLATYNLVRMRHLLSAG